MREKFVPPDVCQAKIFEQVFQQHAASLRNFLYYKCGNIAQAEDFVQEAFVRLWANCAKVTIDKTKGFLYKVASNLFLNQVKHQKVVLKFKQQPVSGISNQSPEFLMEEKEFQEQLKKAITSLPEKQRIVFLMNRIEQKTYREIAEVLEIGVKAVEKRMHKALLELRKLTKKI